MRKIAAIILVCFAALPLQSAQPPAGNPPASLLPYFRFDDPGPFECLETWFPPILIQNVNDLREFIRSDAFRSIRAGAGDPRAMDAIYVCAMHLTHNNTAAALLIAASATFDHRFVAIDNPLFKLAFPLSNESRYEFNRRVANLPVHLYDDTPAIPAGDRDKLQHFFGSAFLTYIAESKAGSARIGLFVEEGEQEFIIGGQYDDRDLRADAQGQSFGYRLLSNNKIYPSEFLTAGVRVPPPGK